MLRNADAFDQDISSWDVNQVTNMNTFMLLANGLSNANYNKLLHHWEADNPVDGLSPNFGGSNADTTSGGVNGETARTNLINNHSWTITDGDS
jgi:surface protein